MYENNNLKGSTVPTVSIIDFDTHLKLSSHRERKKMYQLTYKAGIPLNSLLKIMDSSNHTLVLAARSDTTHNAGQVKASLFSLVRSHDLCILKIGAQVHPLYESS